MRIFSRACICALLALPFIISSSLVTAQETPFSYTDSVGYLTEGADVLPKHGAPGPIATLGDAAFPVVLGEYEEGVYESVVAAAFVGKGRVTAFGHTDYCNVGAMSVSPSVTRFFDNVLRWTSGKEDSSSDQTIRVAVWKDSKTAEFLKGQGFDAQSVSSIDDDFDVFIAGATALKDSEYASLMKAVHKGSGFVTCGLGWGWSQLNPGKSLKDDHPGNRNFAKYGVPLAWTEGMLAPTANNGYLITSDLVGASKYVAGGVALQFLSDLNAKKADVSALPREDARQVASTLALIYRYLPNESRVHFDSVVDSFSIDLVPTAKNPIREDDLISRLTVAVQTERYLHSQELNDVDVETIPAFAAGNDFPGSVPEDAERIDSAKVVVKTDTPGWASTGLYAAPGEIISIKVDPEILASFSKPYRVRIGVHSDRLWHLKNWTRYPEISLEKTIVSPETKVVNPFGGLVYIVVPSGGKSDGLGAVDFEISGAVAAPYFVKGVTSLKNWRSLRNASAPWAELQGSEVVVTVPSSVIRDLDDPQALLDTWDRILQLEAEFASGPYYRERPERITCDREISAGYMHSGYPVMTHMDVEKTLVNNSQLTAKGDWGFFHEFGHNHQSSYWTFDGSGEVTVNYFTLYIMEKLCGLPPEQARKDLSKANRMEKLRRYMANGARFEDWKKDPFLALNMTVQLRNEFGWEPFLRAVSEYRKASPEELPRNDAEKRDQWMLRLSRNVGKNLGPFFDKWGVPTSEEAKDLIKDLPVWLPEEFEELK
ncbi:MAG: M60 family metallopeptidase [Thermoguttaceae bacterium]|nr:M60 family metallopeptidase [Thermoguttaceae bacterium]